MRMGRQTPIIHSIALFVMLVDKKLLGKLIDVQILMRYRVCYSGSEYILNIYTY